jgi:putative endonuclease
MKTAVWTVYILECADKTLYTGITVDIDRRVDEHDSGLGAKYTKGRGPVKVVYRKTYPDRSTASKWELQIKQMKRADKLMLIKDYRVEKGFVSD